jgi:hypothetical protein
MDLSVKPKQDISPENYRKLLFDNLWVLQSSDYDSFLLSYKKCERELFQLYEKFYTEQNNLNAKLRNKYYTFIVNFCNSEFSVTDDPFVYMVCCKPVPEDPQECINVVAKVDARYQELIGGDLCKSPLMQNFLNRCAQNIICSLPDLKKEDFSAIMINTKNFFDTYIFDGIEQECDPKGLKLLEKYSEELSKKVTTASTGELQQAPQILLQTNQKKTLWQTLSTFWKSTTASFGLMRRNKSYSCSVRDFFSTHKTALVGASIVAVLTGYAWYRSASRR